MDTQHPLCMTILNSLYRELIFNSIHSLRPGGESPPPVKSKHPDSAPQLLPSSDQHSNNGKMGDFVRKISGGILSSDKKARKPGILSVEALRKSASSSSIIDEGGGASSESSSSVVSEEKSKKKKFFQTLRNRKPKS